jgi:hypothetical protein
MPEVDIGAYLPTQRQYVLLDLYGGHESDRWSGVDELHLGARTLENVVERGAGDFVYLGVPGTWSGHFWLDFRVS